MYYCHLDTPIGKLLLAGDEKGLSLLRFPQECKRREPGPDWVHSQERFADTCIQLTDYFAGIRKEFDLPLKPSGTEFQLDVLRELQKIPYGMTASYGQIAARIGRPRAVRAVGAANGRNPIPIIIPCHRVVGSRGELTGFGGGLPTKKVLLELEAEHNRRPEMG